MPQSGNGASQKRAGTARSALYVMALLAFGLVASAGGCNPEATTESRGTTPGPPPAQTPGRRASGTGGDFRDDYEKNNGRIKTPPGPGGRRGGNNRNTAAPPPDLASGGGSVPGAQTGGGPVVAIGAWNLEWFGLDGKQARTASDLQATASVIKQTRASLLGLNEIQNEESLDALIRYLPGWRYVLGSSGRQQRCAILYDSGRVALTARPSEWPDVNKDLEKVRGTLRAPLVAPVKIGKFDFLFVVVHSKAMFDDESLQRRREQTRNLRARFDDWAQTHDDKDIIAVGDYNDFADSPALAELTGVKRGGGGAGYVNTGAQLPKDAITHINPNGRIDHVIIAAPATSQSEWTGKAFTYPKPSGAARKYYETRISDHLPTWATFNTSRDDD